MKKSVDLLITATIIIVSLLVGCTMDNNVPSRSFLWTRLIGGEGETDSSANGITVDSSGNIYIVGATVGNFDGKTMAGSTDAFITKYNANGVKQWTWLLGVANAVTEGKGIAIDSDNNFYITGYTSGDLCGVTKTGNYDLFTIKYNANESRAWVRLLGVTDTNTNGAGLAVDANGNCYVTGTTNGNLDNETKIGNTDTFIIKYDTDGTKQWTRLLGVSEGFTHGRTIAIDTNDQCLIAGCTTGNMDGELKTTGYWDVFVTKRFTD